MAAAKKNYLNIRVNEALLKKLKARQKKERRESMSETARILLEDALKTN